MDNFFNNIKLAFSTPANAVISIVDITLTIFLIYGVIMFLKHNNATRIIKWIALVVVLGVILVSLETTIMSKIFSQLVILILILILTLFPQDVKRALWKIASPKELEDAYLTQYGCSDEELHHAINDIVRAVQNMSKKNVGALIIIAPNNIPEHIIESGTTLNAKLSCPLIECLFNTKAPLHDGAVYIRGNIVIAAGCFLPLTQKINLDKELGTRHRAAIGITEQYNHLAIIVSEETGIISVARNGDITRYYDTQMLTDTLEQIYGLKATKPKKKKWKI